MTLDEMRSLDSLKTYKELEEAKRYVTELENRIRALWDKYEGDRKHYMDRIKRLDEEVKDQKMKQAALVSHAVLSEDRASRIKRLQEAGDELLRDNQDMANINRWWRAKEVSP